MAVAVVEPEISLGDFFRVLWRRRGAIALATLGATVLSALVVFLIPVRYAGEAVILPPQPEQSSQALMLGAPASALGLGLLAGGGASSLFRNPGDLYVGLLKSRTVADAIVAKFGLQRLYGSRVMVDTRKQLARRTQIAVGKDLLIHIRVEDADRQRAAAMANAYVDELHLQNSRLALTSAAQRRLFFEEQLRGEREALESAEVAFKQAQQSTGLIYPSGQSAALLRAVAEMRAELASREIEMQRLRLYAGPQNEEARQVEQTIGGLRGQLQKLEGSNTVSEGDILLPVGKLPGAGLDYLRKMRDVKYHETLFELLAKQYEAARIDEARQSPVVQVVDRAVPLDKKSWPPRALLIAICGVLALFISCWIAAARSRREQRAI
jgi:tyrosine-protein kinase Etk/Wzc